MDTRSGNSQTPQSDLNLWKRPSLAARPCVHCGTTIRPTRNKNSVEEPIVCLACAREQPTPKHYKMVVPFVRAIKLVATVEIKTSEGMVTGEVGQYLYQYPNGQIGVMDEVKFFKFFIPSEYNV